MNNPNYRIKAGRLHEAIRSYLLESDRNAGIKRPMRRGFHIMPYLRDHYGVLAGGGVTADEIAQSFTDAGIHFEKISDDLLIVPVIQSKPFKDTP